MDLATYQYLLDLDGDGIFETNISAYVLKAAWRGGRSADYDYDSAGILSLVLDNSDSRFSTFNSASPLYGLLAPGLRVKVLMTVGATTTMMGVLDLESITPAGGNAPGNVVNTATLTAYGILARFTESESEVALQENQDTGALASTFLQAAGLAAGDIDCDAGQTTLSKWWKKKGQSDVETIRELQAAELGRFREGKDGKLYFENRDNPFTAPRNVAQATYGTGTLRIWNLRQSDALTGIHNSYKGNVRTFNHSEDVILVNLADVANGQGGTPLIVPANGSKTVLIELPDSSQYISVYDWTTVDYEANTAADRTGTDITADVSAVKTELGPKLQVVFTNANGSPAHLVTLRAHGIAIVEGDPIPFKSEDSTSQTKYRKREYPNPSNWETNATDAQAKADYVVAQRKDPRPQLTFDVKGNYDLTHLNEVRVRETGDRIHITASEADFGLGIDADFIIDSLSHSVSETREHVMTVVCTKAPTSQYASDGTTYTPKVIAPPGVPQDLKPYSYPRGLYLRTGAVALTNNYGIYKGEFRGLFIPAGNSIPDYADMRTSGEGGTFAHNGTTQFVVQAIPASYAGGNYAITFAEAGTLFFVWRLWNPDGGGTWSDGNKFPWRVTTKVSTETNGDTGPPDDWSIVAEAGAAAGSVRGRASRPATNGHRLLFAFWQIMDTSAGSWLDVDADTAPASTYWDGSAIALTLSVDGSTLTRNSGSGFGSEEWGLALLDVRGGGNWALEHCAWIGVSPDNWKGVDPSSATVFHLANDLGLTPGNDYRMKIVRPPWGWDTDGYFGSSGYIAQGLFEILNADGTNGDINSSEFLSPAFMVPAGVDIEDIGIRVWFGNTYSFSDGGIRSGVVSGTELSYCVPLDDAAVINTDARLAGQYHEKIFRVTMETVQLGSPAANRLLANPTNAPCGRLLNWCFVNNSSEELVIELDTKFRNGKAFPTHSDGLSPATYGIDIVESE